MVEFSPRPQEMDQPPLGGGFMRVSDCKTLQACSNMVRYGVDVFLLPPLFALLAV